MVKWRNRSKNPKYGKIGNSKIISRLKILSAGILAGISTTYIQTDQLIATLCILASASVFVWDIFSQTNSAIDVEKRINDLEKSVKEHKEKLEKKDDTQLDN
ncbi:MAG: hypothetical protein HRU07_05890 [Nitrosopumilus sp.]|nr:hypothetical protein [Nitrosopumilus sp.]NRA05677.1 hypothetical protein [Nitrosopumilus sp.]